MNASELSLSNEPKRLTKSHNHDHFWIEDGELFKSYSTLRGLRYRHLLSVPGMPDEETCSDSCLKFIEKEYLN
jgi:hypothetical protein